MDRSDLRAYPRKRSDLAACLLRSRAVCQGRAISAHSTRLAWARDYYLHGERINVSSSSALSTRGAPVH
ncbi:jg19425 [Pararge aegeria aegeria]|uniref:Jg19425 protein n=1 Tax=Pararge aegeria aegeria TaxID=348720 RepID=A0A8S4R8Y9_9NEOP|nr:jg19425 [Pararge aegeria aegeria]